MESVEDTQSPARTFGSQLRRVRIERGLRQRDLAGDMISASYISFLEADRRLPSERVLLSLCERLNCRPEDLMPPERPGTPVGDTATPPVYLKMARAALTARKFSDAEAWYQRVLVEYQSARAAVREAEYGLAQTAEAEGRWKEAAERYTQCVPMVGQRAYPHSLGVIIGLARCLARDDDSERAVAAATRARQEISELGLDATEAAVEIRAILANVLCEQGDYIGADKSVREALEVIPVISDHRKLIDTYWRASVAAFRKGQLGAAQELAERAADVNAHDYNYTRGMLRAIHGSLLLRQETPAPEAAMETLQSAIQDLDASGATSDAARCRNELANSFITLNRPDDALRAVSAVLEQADIPVQERTRARILRITTQVMLGDMDGARLSSKQAIADMSELAASRQSARLWSQFGEALAHVGDTQGAIAAYRAAISGLGVELPPTLARSAIHLPSSAVWEDGKAVAD